jgi:hypothetical protein
MEELFNPKSVHTRKLVLAKPCPVPAEPGIYAWFFKETSHSVPVDGCLKYKNLTLLYVGISPQKASTRKGKRSKQNLQRRIKTHFKGDASISTLHMSLGSLLVDRLGIVLRQVGKTKRFKFSHKDEERLSGWMEKNAMVTWHVCTKPWIFEDQLIKEQSLPLNLQGNKEHPFHSSLLLAREKAKQMPVVIK